MTTCGGGKRGGFGGGRLEKRWCCGWFGGNIFSAKVYKMNLGPVRIEDLSVIREVYKSVLNVGKRLNVYNLKASSCN